MSRFAYLAALGVLVLNDHVLKDAFPGFLTGKLSDFAGVYVLAVFLAFVSPRGFACIAAGVLFVWWKSPLSDPFIAALPWEASRVVDWTDLMALAMLPLAYRASTPAPVARPAHAVIAMLSLVAFVATTPARYDVPIPENHALRNFDTNRTLAEMQARKEPCHFHFAGDEIYVGWERFRLLGNNIDVDAYAKMELVGGKVRLHFTNIRVTWDGEPDEESYRKELLERLRGCLRK